MKKYFILIGLISLSLIAFAQGDPGIPYQLDTLAKVVSISTIVGGLFITYLTMKNAIKMAELDTKLTKAISDVEDKFRVTLKSEIEKLEGKMELSNKDLIEKMVTKRDIDQLNKNIDLHHELIQEQLKHAAAIYKKDNG